MPRDDLFTNIHKALRLGLFRVTIDAGATEWDDADEVRRLEARWRPLLALLRCHAHHEDRYIFPLLDPYRDPSRRAAADQHVLLDQQLDELARHFDAAVTMCDPSTGLDLYRELAAFVAGYLQHIQIEETAVMDRIWEHCGDDEIAAARAGFMADTPPEVTATTMELVLLALPARTRAALVGG